MKEAPITTLRILKCKTAVDMSIFKARITVALIGRQHGLTVIERKVRERWEKG